MHPESAVDGVEVAGAEPGRPGSAAIALRGLVIAVCCILLAAAALGFGILHGSCPSSAAVWTRFLLSGLILGFMYAMIALGYSMVYGVLQLLNFAHSEVFMVGSFAGLYTLSIGFGFGQSHGAAPATALFLIVSVAGALIVAALASGFAAVAIERIAYRPLRRRGV